jgi:hypothetical protein
VLISFLIEVPEAARGAAAERLDAEMRDRAPSAGPDGPSDALRAASEAVVAVGRGSATLDSIQAPSAPAPRADRCPIHDVALSAAGICPGCRADRLVGDPPLTATDQEGKK